MIATPVRIAFLAVCAFALTGCFSSGGSSAAPAGDFSKRFEVEPHVRLFIQCTGTGPTVLADNGLAIPTVAWAGVRRLVRHVASAHSTGPESDAATSGHAGAERSSGTSTTSTRSFAPRD